MTTKQKVIFALIMLIAFILRGVSLDKIPPHLSNDEISIAYDAYSIAHTLRDEHNHFLPLSFQSHNTYKAPLYIYLSVPTTLIFGNNEYAVKFPSLTLGVLTVLFTGLLVHELTKNANLALLTSFILSITPFHILPSRMALESNIALFFVVLGIYLFYKSLHQQIWLLILSFISFALSMYSYHTEWLFTPLLIAILIYLNIRFFPKKINLAVGIIIFLILIAPLGIDYLNNLHTFARANTETLLSDNFLSRAFKSDDLNIVQKAQLLVTSYLGNYSEYVNLYYLFFTYFNDPLQSHPIQIGGIFTIFIPSFLIGLVKLKKLFKNHYLFILLWAAIAPLVPAFTRGGPNSVRNLVSIVPYVIIIAAGTYFLWNYFKNSTVRKIFLSLLSISFFYFAMIYYHHFPLKTGENFQYGYKQIALFIKQNYDAYQKIVIHPKFGEKGMYDGVPHLYIPYYTYLDPQKFLNERRDTKEGLFVDKYEIRGFKWGEEKIAANTLYVVPHSLEPSEEIASHLKKVHQIKLPNGLPAFELYQAK